MRLRYRILGAAASLLVAGTLLSVSTTVSAVATPSTVCASTSSGPNVPCNLSDTITFKGLVFENVAPTESAPGFATIVSKKCSLKSVDEAGAVPCALSAAGPITATGAGTATATIGSADGTTVLNATFNFNNGTGSGPCTENDAGAPPNPCFFTANFSFGPAMPGNTRTISATIHVMDGGPPA